MELKAKYVALASALILVLAMAQGAFSEEPAEGVHVGDKAVDFTLPLVGSNGEEDLTLSDEIEKYDVIMLYFFFAAS